MSTQFIELRVNDDLLRQSGMRRKPSYFRAFCVRSLERGKENRPRTIRSTDGVDRILSNTAAKRLAGTRAGTSNRAANLTSLKIE